MRYVPHYAKVGACAVHPIVQRGLGVERFATFRKPGTEGHLWVGEKRRHQTLHHGRYLPPDKSTIRPGHTLRKRRIHWLFFGRIFIAVSDFNHAANPGARACPPINYPSIVLEYDDRANTQAEGEEWTKQQYGSKLRKERGRLAQRPFGMAAPCRNHFTSDPCRPPKMYRKFAVFYVSMCAVLFSLRARTTANQAGCGGIDRTFPSS